MRMYEQCTAVTVTRSSTGLELFSEVFALCSKCLVGIACCCISRQVVHVCHKIDCAEFVSTKFLHVMTRGLTAPGAGPDLSSLQVVNGLFAAQ